MPTDNFIKKLKRSNAPIQPVVTLQKQKTFLPSLKSNVKEELRSCVVYKITCHACYVGQTSRHMIAGSKEHSIHKNKSVRKHFDICTGAKLQTFDVRILASSNRGMKHHLTLEALYIREIKPELKMKYEYRSRELTITF